MKCPECVEGGLTSKVYDHGGSRTLLGWQPYYDEDGEYHAHDPNTITSYYSCSNGHSFGHRQKSRCPNKQCTYGGSS